jgi:hypothetical protein
MSEEFVLSDKIGFIDTNSQKFIYDENGDVNLTKDVKEFVRRLLELTKDVKEYSDASYWIAKWAGEKLK